MKYSMKKAFPIVLTIFLLAAATVATHIGSVSVSPVQFQSGSEAEFKVLVENPSGDTINRFELTLPTDSDGRPYFIVTEVAEPAGWNVNTIYKVSASYPYKLLWTTVSSGITEGKSQEFILKAVTPSETSNFQWSWKTVDVSNDVRTGSLTTQSILSPFNTFKVTVPLTAKAGNNFQITVSAMDDDGNVKTDFSGTVTFESSDKMAILPKTYTFTGVDAGSKQLTFKLKTAGDQSITAKSGDVSVISSLISVKPADANSIKASASKDTVSSGDSVEITVVAVDIFGNELDVSPKAKFTIDNEAGGKFSDNSYKAGKSGSWTIVANYISTGKILYAGVPITVVEGQVTQPVQTQPETPAVEEAQPVETQPEVTTESTSDITVIIPDALSVAAGKMVDFNVSVKNTGSVDLTNVALQITGVPDDWITSVPTFINIPAGETRDYIASVAVPETEGGVKILTVNASSLEGTTNSKTVSLTISGKSGMTGLFGKILAQPIYFASGIVILIIVILVIWKVAPKSSKRKKSEE